MKQINTFEFIRKIDEKGYIDILINDKWVKEHIYLVTEFIGRDLNKDECVHHINFCKSDNNLNNLCLMTRKEHSHYHRQSLQFGDTRPLKRMIENNIIQVKLRELKYET